MATDTSLPLGIKADTVARYLMGGALTGAGAASAVNLVKLIKEMDRRRRERQVPSETDEGTIVLTLPKQADTSRSYAGQSERYSIPRYGRGGPPAYDACNNVGFTETSDPPESTGRHSTDDGIAVKDHPDSTKEGMIEKNLPVTVTSGKKHNPQLRHPSRQTFSNKVASNWPTLTVSLLAMGLGGGLGYSIVDKIYEGRQVKEKRRELESAKTEYLDLLAKKSSGPMEKDARRQQTFSLIDLPLGVAALALILGSGGTAYLTKRILEEHERMQTPKMPKPQVKRIIFQSPPGEGGELPKTAEARDELVQLKQAQATTEVFDAALGIYCDILSGEPRVLGHEKLAGYFGQHPQLPDELLKVAVSDFDRLMATLRAPENEPLRRLLVGASMETHPVLRHFRWAAKLPILEGMADRKLYQLVQQAFRPGAPQPLKEAVASVLSTVEPELLKQAGVLSSLNPSLASIMASFYGSSLADKVQQGQEGMPAEPGTAEAAEAAKAEAANPEDRAKELLSKLEIDAADPAAADFVIKNQVKIQRLLKRMAQEGKL